MKLSFTSFRGLALVFAGVLVALTLVIVGCSHDGAPVGPSSDYPAVGMWTKTNPQIASAMAVQNRHTPELMAKSGVIGTATTVGDNGKPAIMLLVTSDKAAHEAPLQIEGVPVEVFRTDPIVAFKGKPGGGGGGGGKVDHKAKQSTPIQMGTSGGWRYDLANGYCCGGTLGALVQVGSSKRILSNYHVFEADIVNGGNGRTAQNGDPIIQPGLIDVGCNAANAQDVATLHKVNSLPGSNVDCSTADIISGMVDATGAILEVGTISASTVAASVNQAVKKSGRTTGLSRSSVSGLNATISVQYENECAGGTAFTKTFTGQIVVANRGSKFLASGDSGSLMVEDVSTNPRAVGLLFAGSSTAAIANPIDEVLNFLGATMVGN